MDSTIQMGAMRSALHSIPRSQAPHTIWWLHVGPVDEAIPRSTPGLRTLEEEKGLPLGN